MLPSCRFVNVLSLNSLRKSETRQESSTSDFVVWRCLNGFQRCQKVGGDGNTDIADQPLCGRLGTAATDRNKQKVGERIIEDRRMSEKLQRSLEWGIMRRFCDIGKFVPVGFSVCLLVQRKTKTAGNRSPIHPTVRIRPPSDCHLFGSFKHHLRGHHYETDEAVPEDMRS
jgi:hypothetical protein